MAAPEQLEAFVSDWRREIASRNTISNTEIPHAIPIAPSPPSDYQPITEIESQVPISLVNLKLDDCQDDTALDIFERAIDLEKAGILSDAIILYRKAFKLDSAVDKAYKYKHAKSGIQQGGKI